MRPVPVPGEVDAMRRRARVRERTRAGRRGNDAVGVGSARWGRTRNEYKRRAARNGRPQLHCLHLSRAITRATLEV